MKARHFETAIKYLPRAHKKIKIKPEQPYFTHILHIYDAYCWNTCIEKQIIEMNIKIW